jgi:hypothetical protein
MLLKYNQTQKQTALPNRAADDIFAGFIQN